jgi:hypothetical protein
VTKVTIFVYDKGDDVVERKPDITDEDVGMRAFNLRKQQSVERAVEKIRHNLGRGWIRLAEEEIELLEWALGETWALMGFYEWNSLAFSSLDLEKIDEILAIAGQIISHKIPGHKGLEQIHTTLKELSEEKSEE